jgi:hypothetical protein
MVLRPRNGPPSASGSLRREGRESKVKSVESNLGTAAAKSDVGLASLGVLQLQ